jgi:hypothetical protein
VPFPDGFTLEEVNMIFNGAFYNTGDDCDGEVVVKK